MCLLAAPRKPKPVLFQPLLLCHTNLCICWTNTYLCRSFLIPSYLFGMCIGERRKRAIINHTKRCTRTAQAIFKCCHLLIPYVRLRIWLFSKTITHYTYRVRCLCACSFFFSHHFSTWISLIEFSPFQANKLLTQCIRMTTMNSHLPNCVQIVFRFNLHKICARSLAPASMIFSSVFFVLRSPVSLIKCLALN